METILCSAIWHDDGIKRAHLPKNIETGIVACGLRHCNCFTVLEAIYPDRSYKNKSLIQGFLTSDGRFVNRAAASLIAFEADQIKRNNKCLFSEDLY